MIKLRQSHNNKTSYKTTFAQNAIFPLERSHFPANNSAVPFARIMRILCVCTQRGLDYIFHYLRRAKDEKAFLRDASEPPLWPVWIGGGKIRFCGNRFGCSRLFGCLFSVDCISFRNNCIGFRCVIQSVLIVFDFETNWSLLMIWSSFLV